MALKRFAAGITAAALLLGLTAGPVLAFSPGDSSGVGLERISGSFDDMTGFEWGLSHVTKVNVKGIFQGRGDKLFAPGAKTSMQEVAVATVRLMDKEAQAMAMSEAAVSAVLAAIPDRSQIADWALKSVAFLVEAGVVAGDAAFNPLADASRLNVAVLLVKALGYEAEAQAKMGTALAFQDAQLIPVATVGYVAAAVDHELIAGFEDHTFRPHQAVKRVEMAAMMGRADRLVERERRDEFKGWVQSVNIASDSFTVKVGDQEKVVRLAPEASVFVNDAEQSLVSLQAGMKVEVKLNASGLAIYVEAKTRDTVVETTVSGTVTALAAATPASLALVSIDGVAYPVSPRATVAVNGQAASLSNVQAGYAVNATVMLGVVVKLEATQPTAVSGTIAALTAATLSAPAKLTLAVTAGTGTTHTEYALHAGTMFKLNGQTAALADVQVGDTATVTAAAGRVSLVEASRTIAAHTIIDGTVIALAATAPGTMTISSVSGTVSIGYLQNGSFKLQTFSVRSTTQLYVNGQAAAFADVRVNDTVKATLLDSVLIKLEVTR